MPDLYSVLAANGYNPYSMPDRDFVPLAIVLQNKDKKYTRVGPLSKFVKFPDNIPKPPDPPLLPPQKESDFSSLSSGQIDASLGLNLLKNIFAQMDITSFSTAINFDRINKIELSYTNVISDKVDPVDIAAYIDPPAEPKEGHVAEQLEVNNTYIIHDILKSDSFAIKCHAQETADSVTEVKAIKKVLEDNGKIKIQEVSDTSLNFKGPEFQTFALRIRPFWITNDSTGKKQFYFRSKPPSLLDRLGFHRLTTRGMDEPSPTPPDSQMVRDSVVLPTGAFYRFD